MMTTAVLNWECSRWHVKMTDFPCDSRKKRNPEECKGCSGAVNLLTGSSPLPIERKTCTTCKRSLNVAQFYKDVSSKDGLSSICKSCHNKYQAKTREKNKKINLQDGTVHSGTKICSICKQELPVENFASDINRKDGLCYRCKECKNESWKEENTPKVRGRYKQRVDKQASPSQKSLPEKQRFNLTDFQKMIDELLRKKEEIDKQIEALKITEAIFRQKEE